MSNVNLRRLIGAVTLTRNTIVTAVTPDYPVAVLTRPTPVQRSRAFELLGGGGVASNGGRFLTIIAELQLFVSF
jgi:hypothetical protein